MMSFQLTDIQKVLVTVAAVDAEGNPAVDLNPLTWSSSDPSIMTAVPQVDLNTCYFLAAGPLGTAQAQVTDGTLSAVLDIEVIASAATGLSMTAGAAENQ